MTSIPNVRSTVLATRRAASPVTESSPILRGWPLGVIAHKMYVRYSLPNLVGPCQTAELSFDRNTSFFCNS